MQEPIASRTQNINVNATIDAATFSLDAPMGYKVENIAKPTVTEAELIAYLGAAAAFNDRTFPGSAIEAFDTETFNAASRLNSTDRSGEANAMIEIRDRIMQREIYRSPVLQFIEDHVEKDSFQYVGDEVQLGDAKSLIAWYRPRGKNLYRAWFGDLSVKEVSAKDLPILNESNRR